MQFIQDLLTAATQVIALAGFGGIILHAMWSHHVNWAATYMPPVAPFEPLGKPQPQDLPEPEDEDIWGRVVEPIQPQRLEVRHFSPVLALPQALEIKGGVNLPIPEIEETDLITKLDVPALRKLCDRHQIAWRHVRGKNRHMNKQVMVFQLQQRLSQQRLSVNQA